MSETSSSPEIWYNDGAAARWYPCLSAVARADGHYDVKYGGIYTGHYEDAVDARRLKGLPLETAPPPCPSPVLVQKHQQKQPAAAAAAAACPSQTASLTAAQSRLRKVYVPSARILLESKQELQAAADAAYEEKATDFARLRECASSILARARTEASPGVIGIESCSQELRSYTTQFSGELGNGVADSERKKVLDYGVWKFAGGVEEGRAVGLRLWFQEHGGGRETAVELETSLALVMGEPYGVALGPGEAGPSRGLDEEERARVVEMRRSLREDVPAYAQERARGHPFLPWYDRITDALARLENWSPDMDDVEFVGTN